MFVDIAKSRILTFSVQLAGIRSDWQRFVPLAQQQQTKVCHRALWELLGVAYALAEILHESDDAWTTFYQLPFWAGRKKSLNRQHVLRYAVQLMVGCARGDRASRACAFANALEDVFFCAQPMPAEDIPRYIEQSGGIDELIAEYRAKKIAPEPSRTTKSLSSASSADSVDDPFDEDAPADEEQVEMKHAGGCAPLVTTREAKPRITRYPAGIRGLQRLEVLIDASSFAGIIDLEDGAETTIRIRVVPNGSSAYRRIEALPDGEG